MSEIEIKNIVENLIDTFLHAGKISITLSIFLLSILVLIFVFGAEKASYSFGYFGAFFTCLIVCKLGAIS